MTAEVVSLPWGLGLTAAAVALVGLAVWALARAKGAEGDIGGFLGNAARAGFLLAWASLLGWGGLYLLGVAAPDALVPGFVVLGSLSAALLIATMVVGFWRASRRGRP